MKCNRRIATYFSMGIIAVVYQADMAESQGRFLYSNNIT